MLQHRAIGTLVLPSPYAGVCFGAAAGLGRSCQVGARGTVFQGCRCPAPGGPNYFHRNELLWAVVSPAAHAYKLLIGTYGTPESVGIPAREGVFKQFCDDLRVQILGQHFGSLINAYRCVQKDLDKAIEVLYQYPNTAQHLSMQLYLRLLSTLSWPTAGRTSCRNTSSRWRLWVRT
ncbi:uncharacterized protein LACBIDRAFT_306564 [Laccaria bicolor S238N-H82]|uniref:Predicted protein n=1 Tax=Laccaria bicolor (strain S238N-H82 / ATCC MYA-4686) TaxID=486041 RepID=B0DNB7_LACBS|nr:uncharacterized protein LACBIDRAFT_306564 [Laccaria bicolor S238N-H82]EDR03840.1 predicted protein [Laccaria bicolor S238N-H82]|eukprot:XP_001885408.1 predicted protein [Laccaria bicolor S238N-H82]